MVSKAESEAQSCLDKHWLHQDVVYNFNSELTGIGGASICIDVVKDTGKIPAPVCSHWIGLNSKIVKLNKPGVVDHLKV